MTVLAISAAAPLRRRQAGDAVADDAGIGLDLDEHDRAVDGLSMPGALIGTGGLSACAVTRAIFIEIPVGLAGKCLSHDGPMQFKLRARTPATTGYNLLVT